MAVNWNFCNIYLTWWINSKMFYQFRKTYTYFPEETLFYDFSRFPRFPFMLVIFFDNLLISRLSFFVDMIMYKCKIFYWFVPNLPLLGNWYLPDLSPKRRIEMNTLKILLWYMNYLSKMFIFVFVKLPLNFHY